MPAIFYHFKHGPVKERVHQSDGVQGRQCLRYKKKIKEKGTYHNLKHFLTVKLVLNKYDLMINTQYISLTLNLSLITIIAY